MNASEHFSTAVHEASHHVAADYFKVCSFPELTPDGYSSIAPSSANGFVGFCHLDQKTSISRFAHGVICWAGVIGECLYATAPDWAPVFKPDEKTLADWFSMVLLQIQNLSEGDQRGIRAYKHPWRCCRSAYRIVRGSRHRILRLARLLCEAQAKKDCEAEGLKWRGVAKPAAFPASREDFVRLICGGLERFDQFITYKAKEYITNGRPNDYEKMKLSLPNPETEFGRSLLFMQQIYGGDIPSADTWLVRAKEFQHWANETPLPNHSTLQP
jgi:hypothetical protein